MSRIRNIKAGFFVNDELAELAPLTRILFAGLWCHADRSGRLEDRPKKIKAEVLPYDEHDVDVALEHLNSAGFILRYKKSGGEYIQIINFHKHQLPHYKEALSMIPPPDGHVDAPVVATGPSEQTRQMVFDRDGRRCKNCGADTDLSLDHIVPRSKGGTEAFENLQTLCRRCNASKNNMEARSNVGLTLDRSQTKLGLPSPSDLGNGELGSGMGTDPGSEELIKQSSSLVRGAAQNSAQTTAQNGSRIFLKTCRSGQEWEVPLSKMEEWENSFPDVDIRMTLLAIRQWLCDNPRRRKTAEGMVRWVGGWMRREQDKPNTGDPNGKKTRY